MNFNDILTHYKNFDLDGFMDAAADETVLRVLSLENLSPEDFLVLLSPAGYRQREAIARKARQVSLSHFGRVIFLYAPLYLSNICDNECAYCGFKHSNAIHRAKLTAADVEKEAAVIASRGIKHILILTGESRAATPVSYIKECVTLLRKYFSSISIEVYPLEEEEYRELAAAGVDGLTVYQETYDETVYAQLHRKGPKMDFHYRLETPDRAARAGIRSIGVAALLGLSDMKRDIFFTALHASYLQNTYPSTEVSVSVPRIQPQVGDFVPRSIVTDKDLVQAIIAMRLFLPSAGITVSTRERPELRGNLIGLGVTRLSAGSKTEVGGYSAAVPTEGQFEPADTSSVESVKAMIESRGYQPVMKDWQTI